MYGAWFLCLSLKVQLFLIGEWMNSSAGLAFAPYVVTVGIGEVRYILLVHLTFNTFYQ